MIRRNDPVADEWIVGELWERFCLVCVLHELKAPVAMGQVPGNKVRYLWEQYRSQMLPYGVNTLIDYARNHTLEQLRERVETNFPGRA